MRPRAIIAIAAWDARALLRNRWLWVLSAAFLFFVVATARVAMTHAGYASLGGFRRAAGGLLTANLLLIPLMALTVGASLVAPERETGRFRLLLAHPITLTEAWIGKWLAGALTLGAIVFTGMGLAGAGLFAAGASDSTALLQVGGLTILLAWSCLGVGLLISAIAATGTQAQGLALVTWLILVLGADLILLLVAQLYRPGAETLFVQLIINPVEAYRISIIHALGASLDTLGPTGQFAAQRYGSRLMPLLVGLQGVWILAAPALALAIERRRGIR